MRTHVTSRASLPVPPVTRTRHYSKWTKKETSSIRNVSSHLIEPAVICRPRCDDPPASSLLFSWHQRRAPLGVVHCSERGPPSALSTQYALDVWALSSACWSILSVVRAASSLRCFVLCRFGFEDRWVALPRCGGSSCRGARASSSPSDLFAASCFVALALRIDVVATALRSSKLPRCTSVVLSFRQRRHSCGLKVPAPRRWSGVGLLGVGATIIGQAGRCRTGGHSSSTQRILERV